MLSNFHESHQTQQTNYSDVPYKYINISAAAAAAADCFRSKLKHSLVYFIYVCVYPYGLHVRLCVSPYLTHFTLRSLASFYFTLFHIWQCVSEKQKKTAYIFIWRADCNTPFSYNFALRETQRVS